MRKYILILLLFFVYCANFEDSEAIEQRAFDMAIVGEDAEEQMDDSLVELYDRTSKLELEYLVIHCSATPEGFSTSHAFYERVWESRGWKNPGYHLAIDLDGTLIWMGYLECEGLSWNNIRNGVRGFNLKSFHVAYSGGVDRYGKPKDTRTDAQKVTMNNVVSIIRMLHPDIKVRGHRDMPNVAKACPSFDVESEYGL